MPRPAPSAAISLSSRFSLLIEGLRQAVAARSAAERALAPLLVLVWNRLGRMARRFAAAAARAGAQGSLPAGVRARPGPTGERPSRKPLPPRERMPREFGWLLRLVPGAAQGSRLQHLLADPEMVELLAAAPEARRVLRSLCRMLAVAPGPELALPKRKERGRPKCHAGQDGEVRGPPSVEASPARARRGHVLRERVARAAGLALLRWRPADGVG